MSTRYGGVEPLQILDALHVANVLHTSPVSGGWDTLIWRVETESATYALRLFRPDQAEQCRHEVRAMTVASTLGVPVPQVIRHGIWRDRPAMLLEWCAGRPILEEARDNPTQIESLGRSMGRLQARLHSVTVPAEYRDNHEEWLHRAGPNEEELITRLRELGLRDGHLLHLDYHPLNVLATDGGATIILDWSNGALAGDPRADVARTSSILRLVATPPAIEPSMFGALRDGLLDAWMAGYQQVAGPPGDMTLFDIWATLYFIRDLEPKLDMPGFFMQESDFDRLRGYASTLKQRAGLHN